jgi:hypothetical protein
MWFVHKFIYTYVELSSRGYCVLVPWYRTMWITEILYLQNRYRVCLAETLTKLCILDFFKWVRTFASKLPQPLYEEECKLSTSVIILCSKAKHFTISTPVSTFVSVALCRIPPVWNTNSKSTFNTSSCTRQSITKYYFTSVWRSSVRFH